MGDSDAAQKIRLISFPEPEILSIESDYKYYNFDEGLFNLVSRDDFTRIQADGKKQIEVAAIKSDLPKIAKEQMRMILTEVMQSKNGRSTIYIKSHPEAARIRL